MQCPVKKPERVARDHEVFSVVLWLKKADATTFEYLMQLKICSVLLAVFLL